MRRTLAGKPRNYKRPSPGAASFLKRSGGPPTIAPLSSRDAVRQGLFGDEHTMLRKSVRAFVEKEVAPSVDEWEAAGRIPRAFWRRLGELGFLGLEFPVEYGGGGGDFISS